MKMKLKRPWKSKSHSHGISIFCCRLRFMTEALNMFVAGLKPEQNSGNSNIMLTHGATWLRKQVPIATDGLEWNVENQTLIIAFSILGTLPIAEMLLINGETDGFWGPKDFSNTLQTFDSLLILEFIQSWRTCSKHFQIPGGKNPKKVFLRLQHVDYSVDDWKWDLHKLMLLIWGFR